jgi:hypothetical protein
VFRRQFLLTALASVLAGATSAQEQKTDGELDLGPVKGTEELWYLLTALDALIFCLAVAVIKDQAVIVQAPGGSALHLAAERPEGRGSVQRGVEIKRGASADRAEQDRHQRRRKRDRHVADRCRVAIGPRQRRSCIRAILGLTHRARGREPVVVVPRLCVPESAVLAGD